MKISALPAATATAGAELIPIVQGGVTSRVPISALLHGLCGVVTLIEGQSDYAVDITAVGLTSAPRGAVCTLIVADNTKPAFGAHFVAGTTTATSLALHCDAPPPDGTFGVCFLLIP